MICIYNPRDWTHAFCQYCRPQLIFESIFRSCRTTSHLLISPKELGVSNFPTPLGSRVQIILGWFWNHTKSRLPTGEGGEEEVLSTEMLDHARLRRLCSSASNAPGRRGITLERYRNVGHKNFQTAEISCDTIGLWFELLPTKTTYIWLLSQQQRSNLNLWGSNCHCLHSCFCKTTHGQLCREIDSDVLH